MKLAPVFLIAASGLGICCGAQGQARVADTRTYAVVAPVDDEAGATPFAEAHCAKPIPAFQTDGWAQGDI
jgi:hypothetical protein